jgi:hypothetical protein
MRLPSRKTIAKPFARCDLTAAAAASFSFPLVAKDTILVSKESASSDEAVEALLDRVVRPFPTRRFWLREEG